MSSVDFTFFGWWLQVHLLIQAAAMFKVMRDTPTIPDSLSYEARDFLKCCFQRNPAERPTAAMLLEHPFMKNLQHPDAPSCLQAVAGANLMVDIT